MDSTASARWLGGIKDGQGSLSTNSATLSGAAYSYETRFEGQQGTNPEELIAAAHAGCFAMALSKILGDDGHAPERIDAKATVSLKADDEGIRLTHSHLDVSAKVGGISADQFQSAASEAKENCPISAVLDLEISMDARLEG